MHLTAAIAQNAGHACKDRPRRISRPSPRRARRAGPGAWPAGRSSGRWPLTRCGRGGPGRPAPKLELVDLDGKPWRLDALKGRALVMNFWASWCEPCRAEMPSLELLARRHERDGLAVLAVNYKESLPTIRRFLDAQPVDAADPARSRRRGGRAPGRRASSRAPCWSIAADSRSRSWSASSTGPAPPRASCSRRC